MRREVGRLLRIQWQLRLHGLVRSSFNGTAKWSTQVRGRHSFTAPKNQDSADNAENRQDTAEPDDLENRSAVPCARRVVVIAIQQDVIDGRADPSGRRVHEAEAHVAPGIFDAVEVARNAAVRGKNHNPARVSEQTGLRIEGQTEICGLGRRVNRFLRAGEEMPTGIRFRSAEAGQGFLLLFRSHLRSFAGIETDEDNFVVTPGIEREHSQHADHALFNLIAKHGAAVVDEGKRSEEHTSELQSLAYLVCRLLLEKKKKKTI